MYMLACVDNNSRYIVLYGLARKSDTLAQVKRYLADINDIGVPKSFRIDNGGEFLSQDFFDFCDNVNIRRELTAPDTPKHNAVAESAIWRTMKAGHAARCEATRLFPDITFGEIPHLGGNLDRLWLEAVVWAADGFNRSACLINPGKLPPYQLFTGKQPPRHIVPFLQPGMMRVNRRTKMDPQSVRCYYLNSGSNHSSTTVKVIKAATGAVCYTNNVAWTVPRQPLYRSTPLDVRGEGGRATMFRPPTPLPAFPHHMRPPPTPLPPEPPTPLPAFPHHIRPPPTPLPPEPPTPLPPNPPTISHLINHNGPPSTFRPRHFRTIPVHVHADVHTDQNFPSFHHHNFPLLVLRARQ